MAPEAKNDSASKTITQSLSSSSKSVHIDDSVMERFNILSRREEKLGSSFMQKENDSVKVASDAEDSVTMPLNISRKQGNNFSSSFMDEKKASDMVSSDTEDSVMERFNILRRGEESLKSSFMKEKKDQDVVANDAEDSVKARLNILRQRGNDLNSSFMEEKKDPDIVPNDAEDSVMARLNILKHRGDNLNSLFMEAEKDPDMVAADNADMGNFGLMKGEIPKDQRANVVIEPYFYHPSVKASEGYDSIGCYANGSGYDSMKQFLLSVADDPVVHSNRKARLGYPHYSGLYDSSSSDWEHVAKDEFV